MQIVIIFRFQKTGEFKHYQLLKTPLSTMGSESSSGSFYSHYSFKGLHKNHKTAVKTKHELTCSMEL